MDTSIAVAVVPITQGLTSTALRMQDGSGYITLLNVAATVQNSALRYVSYVMDLMTKIV